MTITREVEVDVDIDIDDIEEMLHKMTKEEQLDFIERNEELFNDCLEEISQRTIEEAFGIVLKSQLRTNDPSYKEKMAKEIVWQMDDEMATELRKWLDFYQKG